MKKTILFILFQAVFTSVFSQSDSTKQDTLVCYKIADINAVIKKIATIPYEEIWSEMAILRAGRLFVPPSDSSTKKPIKKP